MARSNTKALSGRDPANKPATHGVMTPEFFNEASTYKLSLDRHGMNLSMSNGGKFGNPIAESNDRPGDVKDAINGPEGGTRGYGREGRPGKQDGPREYPSGCHMKGYGR